MPSGQAGGQGVQGLEGGLEAGLHAGLEAVLEGGLEGGLEAGLNAGLEAGLDAGLQGDEMRAKPYQQLIWKRNKYFELSWLLGVTVGSNLDVFF